MQEGNQAGQRLVAGHRAVLGRGGSAVVWRARDPLPEQRATEPGRQVPTASVDRAASDLWGSSRRNPGRGALLIGAVAAPPLRHTATSSSTSTAPSSAAPTTTPPASSTATVIAFDGTCTPGDHSDGELGYVVRI